MATNVITTGSPAGTAPVTSFSSHRADAVLAGLGRALFGLPFAVFGINHVLHAQAMAGMVPVPGGVFWIYLTGAALIAAAVGILTGILARWAALGLALLLLTFVALIHIPGLARPEMAQLAMANLLKDLALAGGALIFASTAGKRRRS
jgi:uncharacterized membrane protein YphA (DoxX/SURF4 family)